MAGAEDPSKSRKPANTAFKQQRLKAWQPFLTPKTVLPTFFIVGILFVPIGIGLVVTSGGVQEVEVEYSGDKCIAKNLPAGVTGPVTCADLLQSNPDATCSCDVAVELKEAMESQVYVYYGLTNFYQNHRRYVKSRDDAQLMGTTLEPGGTAATCDPYTTTTNDAKQTVNYVPCGLIANSLWNDTFAVEFNTREITLGKNGIAWPSDAETKFKNPDQTDASCTNDTTPECRRSHWGADVVKPPYWPDFPGSPVPEGGPWQLYASDATGWGYQNEDFVVWMRTAGLPSFRKLYGIVRDPTLRKGTYTVTVDYRFPVKAFSGTKSIIFSTTSMLGGKNPFLGYAYVIVGVLCLALGIGFLARHMIKPRKLGDHQYLKWQD